MERLFLEDFRCFDGPRDIRLAPITVLVGENSTGKTSFLASIRVAWDIAFGQRPPNFNEEPFDLGSFEHIANFRARRIGRSDSFRVGATHSIGDQEITVEGTFLNDDSQPSLSAWTAQWDGHRVNADMRARDSRWLSLCVNGREALAGKIDPFPLFRVPSPLAYPMSWHLENLYKRTASTTGVDKTAVDETCEVLRTLDYQNRPRPSAFAPIRSRPERTYDPRVAPEDSFGGHVPLALRQVLTSRSENDRSVKEALVSFGEASGLFAGLRVRNLGTAADPFQLNIHNAGLDRNLIDVGYGVSQILPVMFDAFRGDSVSRSCSSNLKSTCIRRPRRSSQVRSLG